MLFGLNEAAVATPAVATNLFNESYDFVAMEQEMIVESARAWNKIQYMVGEANCRLIHESVTNPNGLENLMEGVVGGFFAKVKEFFIKLKNMIMEVFNKFMMWVNSKMKSEKDFAMKYEKEILEKIVTIGEIDVKGFTYTNLDTAIPDIKAADEISITGDDNDAKRKSIEDIEAKYRGACVGEATKAIESEDFSENLFTYYRNGEDAPEEMTLKAADVKSIFNELKTFAKTKSDIEKDKGKIEKDLNKAIKVLETAEKNLKNGDDADKENKITNIQLKIGAMKTMATNRNQAFTAKIAAVKERAEFGKRVVLAVKSAKKQNNSTVGGLFSMSI